MPNISKSLPTVPHQLWFRAEAKGWSTVREQSWCGMLAALVVVLVAYHALFPPADITLRPSAGEAKNFRIPVNRASVHDLQYFFGMTDRRARAIVRERDASPLTSKADLARVREIPPVERERIAAFTDFSTGGGG